MPNYRIQLTEKKVAKIYMHKLRLLAPKDFRSCLEEPTKLLKGQSSILAQQYGVSAKTIRDIWSHRSWTSVTYKLQHPAPTSDENWQQSDVTDPFHNDWPHWDTASEILTRAVWESRCLQYTRQWVEQAV